MKPTSDPQYEIIDTRTAAPLDIETALAQARSGTEIQSLLRTGNNAKPSGALRRRWLRAASQAYERLRQANAASMDVSSRAAGVDAEIPVLSQNAEKTGGAE